MSSVRGSTYDQPMPLEFRRPGQNYMEGASLAPANVPMAAVQAYAENVSRLLRVTEQQRLDTLVDELGGTVHYGGLEWGGAPSGTIYVHAPSEFDVCVSEETSPARERFTLAHELGHYFLHSKMGQKPLVALRVTDGSPNWKRVEWEANWFAAGFLMPSEAFRQALAVCGHDVAQVARQFFVSREAARVRASALGLPHG